MKRVFLVFILAWIVCSAFAGAYDLNSVILRTGIGSACSQSEDCGEGFHCIEDSASFAGGYCIKFDCSALSPCDVGSRCLQPEELDFSLCLASCSDDTHCRKGYACQEEGVCLPAHQK